MEYGEERPKVRKVVREKGKRDGVKGREGKRKRRDGDGKERK